MPISSPASMPIISAYTQSRGIISISASMRGSTRNSMGGMPMVLQGIDLFIDLHGAELRRKRRARAPGHDDAGHHRPHLARHAQPDQVGDDRSAPQTGATARPP